MSLNGYFWLILGPTIALHLLDVIANRLNAKSLRNELPDSFRGIYDEAEYQRLLDYTAVRSRFELLESTFMLAVLLAFWFCGGYAWLDELVRAAGLPEIGSGLIFIGALWLGHALLSVPFDAWETFVIEERFGFNKSTPGLFFADLFKSLALGVVIGGPLLALLLLIFEQSGPLTWLIAWVAVTAVLVAFVYLAPVLILPLFNKFTPLEDGELKEAILAFGRREGFPIGGVFVMDGSKRSTKSNAFFTGLGRTRKVVLFDTLIANHSTDELIGVLAHEIGHYKLRHIQQHLVVAVANLGIFLLLAAHFIHAPGLFAAFGVERPSGYVGIALFLLFYNPLSRLLHILRGFQSRRHEFDADRFAARTTGKPGALAAALKKLSKANLSNLSPHPLHVVLYHSHPPVLARVKALGA
jgi:STE24 endopeptidase